MKTSRDLLDVSTSQGMPRAAGSHQKLGERHGMYSPSEPPEGTNPSDTLTSDLLIPQQGENKLLFQATKLVVIYYGVPRKLMQ